MLLIQSLELPKSQSAFHYEVRDSEALVVASPKGSSVDHQFLQTFTEALTDESNAGLDIMQICDVVSHRLHKTSPTPAFEARSSMEKRLAIPKYKEDKIIDLLPSSKEKSSKEKSSKEKNSVCVVS